ncbi:DNA cytosine methyltransferase [Aureibacter tunicatorum]|uniref:Cytosine-specific methyltransferase n=1 Tax=Aureibacter tunicatorum TaxID=866807 RepID=A0AAE3XQB9_9BACT|nr:DNA cytosine methyltransferase [Aureibacter tunicatorum]MDR6239986.1 DNA (cytosine-5)-methyltransferase 1 [Aureibacter tunicatorum]BDD04458.1 cytosine-specific methyltransferase [Aureibacter tunicatorum]
MTKNVENIRPKVIDLFAGAGGLSLGFEQAGFDIICAVEIDPVHASIHEYNFPYTNVIAKPIQQVNGDLIRNKCGLKPDDEIEVLVGGAPCQGFSLIGQRALDDPRNSLVKDYIRLIKELRPKYFLFENVKGLTIGKHKKFLDEIVADIKELGYAINLPWKVLNAKDFGVPQSRERLFLLGSRDDCRLPQYPAKLNKIITCKEALDDLPDAESFIELLEDDCIETKYVKKAHGYSAQLRCTNKATWKYGYQRKWNSKIITSSRRTNHSDISRSRFSNTLQGAVEPISRFFKLPENGVSNTLRAGTDSSRGAFTSPRPIHYKYSRCITVREMARLHGFPDWFRFNSTKWHGARQIGNSVPPPLAFSLACEIMMVLPHIPFQPKNKIKLGKTELIYADITTASLYWGVDNPIGKRDRKSGIKKRKQIEIETI